YIIILVLVTVLGVAGWYFLSRLGGNQTPTVQTPNSPGGLFPFGQGPAATSTAGNPTNQGHTGSTTIDLSGNQPAAASPRLRQISSVPAAGAVAFDAKSGTSTQVIIRYMERATGHIYDTPTDDPTVTQISNITIPKIYQALWSVDGTHFVLRYLDSDNQTIKTFVGRVSTTTDPEKAIDGVYLPDGIADLTVAGSNIFYLDENINGAQGIRANLDGSAKTDIFDSSFGDWAAAWTSPDIVLYPRPSGSVEASAYYLNPKTSAFSEILNGTDGLAARSNPDGSLILYSGTTNGALGTAVFNIKKGTSVGLGVTTLADKCVWSAKTPTLVYCAVPKSLPAGSYPDDWYKGKVAFDDALWSIDTKTGQTTQIFDPLTEAGTSMDMTNLSLDPTEKVLVLMNKDDLTVWRYDLTQ
ncbi:MAG: hypothetical protein KGH68_02400, partial [Patescibacteria group bacterium]|nr:hypothetical protein [Patescibacteria group bacterium]